MKYVALLRGINVGGNNKINMKQLSDAMSKAGFEEVSTYINSGNIFFSANNPEDKLANKLEQLIKNEFGLDIKVLLRNKDNIDILTGSIPSAWTNGGEMKCDVMFLWEDYDDKSVLGQLTIKPEIDDVRYVQGALIWKIDRNNITKSGMMKIVGTELYRNMTVRNCNTVRKIKERLNS
jgi:uncharacterized protein (DUF1697 family)